MARFISFILILLVIGCSYIDEPQAIFKDPHYSEYQAKIEDLERVYLRKQITYAEYRLQKKQLDDEYTYEIKDRENVILGNE